MNKKMPMRKCLGCGEMCLQRELVRVVKTKLKTNDENGEEAYEISLDLVGKKPGRGAYVCRKTECFEKAVKAKRFQKALSCVIPDDVIETMRQEMEKGE